jgi:phosphoglycerate dehydrogenase-like enzyme
MHRTTPADTKLVICIHHAFTEWRAKPLMAESIRQRWPEMRVVHVPDYPQLPEQLADMDIFVGSSLRAEQFKLAAKLKWIHASAAGVSQLMYPELRRSGVLLTNASGVFSIPMAEHTMALLLAMNRNLPQSIHQFDRALWNVQELWDNQNLTELNGKVLLIIGYGSIGREIARRAKAFDMRVWGVTRSGKGDAALAERVAPVSELHGLLPHADYVVIAAPQTQQTDKLIGREELALLKPEARLVNVSRGSLLDEKELIRALEEGRLAGAALDVTESEPLPPDNPLWKAPRLFLTPHTSALSDRLWHRQTDLVLQLLERWFSNQPMFNQVDLNEGY